MLSSTLERNSSDELLHPEVGLVAFLMRAATEDMLFNLFEFAGKAFDKLLSYDHAAIVLGDKTRSKKFKARFMLEYSK